METSFGIAAEGRRLPAATRLGAVRLQVSNIATSLDYYQQVIGLAVHSRSEAHALLGASASSTTLVELHEQRDARPVNRHARLGLYHFAILVPDRSSLGRFIAHLAEVDAYAATADHAVSEAVYLWDPDGLGIEVYADRPRTAWRVRGRELYMTTEPLNVSDLVRAADGQRWNGLPVGTVIGHVHLHVGELGAAEAFYHSALGFDKTVWNYPGALFLSAGGYHHHLGTNTWAAGAPPATDGDARLIEWQLVLPSAEEIDTAAGRLQAAGYAPVRETSGWTVRDPWGTQLRLSVSQAA